MWIWWIFFCLFDLILYVPLTIFQLNRDGSSWVEPVLSSDKCLAQGWQRNIRERSGSVVECLTQGRRAMGLSLAGVTASCPWARHIYPSLILVQPRKTLPFITERLLMGCKESNKQNNATYLSPLPSSFSLKKWVFNISPAGSRALRSWSHSSVSSVDQTLGPLDKSPVLQLHYMFCFDSLRHIEQFFSRQTGLDSRWRVWAPGALSNCLVSTTELLILSVWHFCSHSSPHRPSQGLVRVAVFLFPWMKLLIPTPVPQT